MTLPTPEDPARAPIWENYATAQTSQASLGLIPDHAYAVGVEVNGRHLRLRFQLSRLTEEDEEDMRDIVSELEALVAQEIYVDYSYEFTDRPRLDPHDGVSWIYATKAK
ncbi:hypothetical protein [Acidipropionibacterium virtanenii]|uniref:Uncharacterized protein n=1 Tax=Acidipropionibacterium virtanenii TaxID=2057246 RepID=A0A344UR95_9ACTN|nr:hypothetical protein [Acidipropionibacterium virtanenii]AXE37793.1 hypothetical protein JS278_00601 [Acidipropionibacterium virtanenii]